MEVTRNCIRESGIDDSRNRNFSDNVWNLKNILQLALIDEIDVFFERV
jgi:hypothetical protein